MLLGLLVEARKIVKAWVRCKYGVGEMLAGGAEVLLDGSDWQSGEVQLVPTRLHLSSQLNMKIVLLDLHWACTTCSSRCLPCLAFHAAGGFWRRI